MLDLNKFQSKLANHISLPLRAAMAGEIKLFQNVQKLYGTLGIHPPNQSYQANSLNRRNLFFLSSSSVTFASSIAYLLFEARTISDYGVPFCVSVIIFSGLAVNVIQIWRGENIYQFIANSDAFIEQSE